MLVVLFKSRDTLLTHPRRCSEAEHHCQHGELSFGLVCSDCRPPHDTLDDICFESRQFLEDQILLHFACH